MKAKAKRTPKRTRALSASLPVDAAENQLKNLLRRLRLGETITLVAPDGAPLAILISLNPASAPTLSVPEWQSQWQTLSEEISRAWKGDKSAVEALSEMRR